MEKSYDTIISELSGEVIETMRQRVSAEDLMKIKRAFEVAEEAHKEQRRKSGEPYIIHPISVALIAAKELKLDTSSVCAAFLHDVVEDTPTTVEEIEEMFGPDVAFLVDIVTKKKKSKYNTSKQVDNYQQLLQSVHYDIRALMVKIADRLHNMRTLQSMRLDKQMKIAGETDYFYAPLANRLGLFDVKTDLENLSFQYRCPLEYNDIYQSIIQEENCNEERLKVFTDEIHDICLSKGIDASANIYYRKPYSIWRKMTSMHRDFAHIDNKYYVRVTFDESKQQMSSKDTCLKIYSVLTSRFNERPQSFNNQIDLDKENSYKSLNVMLLSKEGIWEDVQICSNQMVESSKVGCMAGVDQSNVGKWIEKFKLVLKDIADESHESGFIEKVATTLYYDDIMTFTPEGKGIRLPKGATAIDFAFEIGNSVGMHAKHARINGHLASIKTELLRGDCVEIGIDQSFSPSYDWLDHCCSYKAKRALKKLFAKKIGDSEICCCPNCAPIPGGDCIGFKMGNGTVMIHRRSCRDIITLASKHGDSIVDIDFKEDKNTKYPVTMAITAIDRYHLLIDIIDYITNKLGLSIDSLTTVTKDEIVDCQVTFFVHSVNDLRASLQELCLIDGVEEVKQVIDR